MSEHRRHRRIHDSKLKYTDRGTFAESRHNPTWLAEKVARFSRLRGDNLTKRQRRALIWYRTDSIFNLGPADEHRKDKDVLTAYQTLFDDMFFFGSLFQRCHGRICHATGNNIHIKGQTTRGTRYKLKWLDRLLDRETPLEVEITVFRDEDTNRPRRLKGYLETLLHEMCHAFFDLYGCRFDGCYNVWEKQGAKGHGHAWQDIALAVEIAAADKNLLGLSLDLGRKNSLAVEMVYEERSAASNDELARWGMEQVEVDRIRGLVVDQQIVSKLWGVK